MPLIAGPCLGEAILAVCCLAGVSVLAGIALADVFDRGFARRCLAGLVAMMGLRRLPPA